MKAFAISTFLFLLAAKLNAAPTSTARQFEAQLTFEGAPPEVAFFNLSVPTDGSVFHICTYPAPHLPNPPPPPPPPFPHTTSSHRSRPKPYKQVSPARIDIMQV